jgi:thiol:disulfide interchange protein DsbC
MQRFTFRLTSLALAAMLGFLGAIGASAAPQATDPANAAMSKDALAVKQAFETKFAGAVVSNVSKSPYFGLYELQLDDKLLYTDAKVTYVVVGAIYDATSKTNVTEARMRKLNRVDWDTLPLDLAIKKVKGDGSRKLAIFSDADCPYCKQLEREMKNLTNVTTYTFLFPIDQLHPDSARKSAAIWCSPDRLKAWDDWFENGKLPENAGDCATPIKETAELGRKYRMNATPTLVFADGSVVPGALPLDRLEVELKQAEAEAQKTTAAKQ